MHQLMAGEGSRRICLVAYECGKDLVVAVTGGDSPHVGCVAVSVARPSLAEPSVTSSTCSVIALVGHKDDELAKPVADFLARELRTTVVVTVGIHIENATLEDIHAATETAWLLVRELAERVGAVRRSCTNDMTPR